MLHASGASGKIRLTLILPYVLLHMGTLVKQTPRLVYYVYSSMEGERVDFPQRFRWVQYWACATNGLSYELPRRIACGCAVNLPDAVIYVDVVASCKCIVNGKRDTMSNSTVGLGARYAAGQAAFPSTVSHGNC